MTPNGSIHDRCPVRALALLSALLTSAWVAAHPGHHYTALHADNLAEALRLAGAEHKLVYLYVRPAGGQPCPYLQRPTPRTAGLMDLFVLETIVCVLDAEQHAEALRPFLSGGEPLPRSFLLGADGQVLATWPGKLQASEFETVLRKQLSGPDTVERVRAALIKRGHEHFFSRERLAKALDRSGGLDAAKTEYEWCLEESLLQAANSAAVVRRAFLLKGVVEFSRRHPPAVEMLRRWQDDAERLLATGRDDAHLARDLGELNHLLGESDRTLRLYDVLPASSQGRRGLFDRLFDLLIEQQRYAEVLDHVRPLEAFRGEAQFTAAPAHVWSVELEGQAQRGQRTFAVRRGARLVEALAGVGKPDAARELADEVLQFDPTESTRELLLSSLARTTDPSVQKFVRDYVIDGLTTGQRGRAAAVP